MTEHTTVPTPRPVRQELGAAEAALTAARASHETFLQITPARAQRDAERACTNGGPLAGVPFAVKDVFDVAGTRTSGGSQLFDRRPHARADAEAVRRLTRAGAVCIGKTTLSELAYSGLGVNERYGTPTLHRDGAEYVVGGSSSGSAAAVSARTVAVALASDTSGSARIPAAWAGVYGFRPSLGRYPTTGMLPLAPTLDTVGIIAADAATLIRVDAVLAADPQPVGDARRTKFVVPHDEYLDLCDPSVLERFYATVERLRESGIAVSRRRIGSLDDSRALHDRHLPIVEEEAFARYGPHSARHPDAFTPAVRRRLDRARSRGRVRSTRPLRAAMEALRAQLELELDGAILLSPPTEISAPALEEVRASTEAEDALNTRALRLTMVLSYLDSPSAVVPVGPRGGSATSGSSLQLSGSAAADHRVLAAAEHLALLTA